ncbi:MAG: outer membrane lipoprotein-sorting protein [Thermodesulfobacteriota bacterium]|nr:outer membrane lipoprotein-sorting protein [Thermodesulfobacteriota bacterium]
MIRQRLASRSWRCPIAIAVATAIICLAAPAFSAENAPSVDTIVDNALRINYYNGTDGRASVEMTITDKQGRERNRSLIILRRDMMSENDTDENFIGDQKFYVYFRRPADVRGMSFMVWKHTDSDDDRWLYLPDLDLVKRIASSEERTSFVGSHFFYEDVSGRNKNEDTHELVETTDNYYVLKSTPKDPGNVEFAYYKMWIHKASFVVTQTKYYDQNDKVYREYKVLNVENIQGFPTVIRSQMTDQRMGGHTIINYSNVTYNTGLPDNIFTERYLRKPPIQYMR